MKNYVLMSTSMCQRHLKCHMPQIEFLTYPLHLHSKCMDNFSILANMLISHTGVWVRNWMKFFSISLPLQINQLSNLLCIPIYFLNLVTFSLLSNNHPHSVLHLLFSRALIQLPHWLPVFSLAPLLLLSTAQSREGF